MTQLAWGNKVSENFRTTVFFICSQLSIKDPSWLMACMAFETGETFSTSIINQAGSGAVGLIQFMPSTASALGTTVEDLASMSDYEQLLEVRDFFKPWSGKLHSLGDVYAVILWPGMIGKPDDVVIFDSADKNHPKLYLQNKGLDFNKDGTITKAEIVARVQTEFTRGLLPENVWDAGDAIT